MDLTYHHPVFLILEIRNARANCNNTTEHLINDMILYYWEVRWSGSPTSCWVNLVSERMIKYHVAGISDWRAYIHTQILCIYVNSAKWSLHRDFFRCHYFGWVMSTFLPPSAQIQDTNLSTGTLKHLLTTCSTLRKVRNACNGGRKPVRD
jgi:hypothetical protein